MSDLSGYIEAGKKTLAKIKLVESIHNFIEDPSAETLSVSPPTSPTPRRVLGSALLVGSLLVCTVF